MGLDSVEIVLCWEDSLGISVPDDELSKVTTPAESIELLSSLVKLSQKNEPCLSLMAFHKIRDVLEREFGIERSSIKPKTTLAQMFERKGRRKQWAKFKEAIGISDLSYVVNWSFFAPGQTAIKDVVCEIVARDAKSLIEVDSGWSRSQLREVVRESVTYVVGETGFSDNDRYVQDIGID